jgi:hypothetical protein
MLMDSRRPSVEYCGAVAAALYLLRPAAARTADHPAVRDDLARGLALPR